MTRLNQKPPIEIENLVFEGGGPKGIANIGVVNILETLNLLKNIRRFAGTSIGSVVAMLLSLGYTGHEIKGKMYNKNFIDFLSILSIFNSPLILVKLMNGSSVQSILAAEIKKINKNFGVFGDKELIEWLQNSLREKGFSVNMTFQQLHQMTGKSLYVVACNLTRKIPVVFCPEKTPEMQVYYAVRLSISIPILFKPGKLGNEIYVDGGVLMNFPIHLFDFENKPNPKTLGIRLKSSKEIAYLQHNHLPEAQKINTASDFLSSLSEVLLNAQEVPYLLKMNTFRCIFVDCGDVGLLSQTLTDQQKDQLISAGAQATQNYFMHSSTTLYQNKLVDSPFMTRSKHFPLSEAPLRPRL